MFPGKSAQVNDPALSIRPQRPGRLAVLRRRLFGPITEFRTAARVAALTFDDGPNPTYTPRLLEVLARHGAKATFFMVGRAARAYPGIVRAVVEAGHAIGNHSHSHCDFLTVSQRRRIAEIRTCSNWLGEHEAKVFRPPYGRENLATHFAARSLGYEVVKWTISTGDWEAISSGEIFERMRAKLKPGAIILLHDGHAKDPLADRSATVDAVERLLQETREYSYLTVPDLLMNNRSRRRS
jgi:peptidoglycan/xylan/chitin deacetylase (PgdA/CDA1 family)